jgi:hypothetical protein
VDYVPELHRQLQHLVDDRIGILAGEFGIAAAAASRLAVMDCVGRKQHTVVPGVAGLAAAVLALGFPGRGRLDVRPVGRRRLVGVRRVPAELGFEFGDAGGEAGDLAGQRFEAAEVVLHRRGGRASKASGGSGGGIMPP